MVVILINPNDTHVSIMFSNDQPISLRTSRLPPQRRTNSSTLFSGLTSLYALVRRYMFVAD
jgi:hypothetical protein